jgi:chromosome segregation ATPase
MKLKFDSVSEGYAQCQEKLCKAKEDITFAKREKTGFEIERQEMRNRFERLASEFKRILEALEASGKDNKRLINAGKTLHTQKQAIEKELVERPSQVDELYKTSDKTAKILRSQKEKAEELNQVLKLKVSQLEKDLASALKSTTTIKDRSEKLELDIWTLDQKIARLQHEKTEAAEKLQASEKKVTEPKDSRARALNREMSIWKKMNEEIESSRAEVQKLTAELQDEKVAHNSQVNTSDKLIMELQSTNKASQKKLEESMRKA